MCFKPSSKWVKVVSHAKTSDMSNLISPQAQLKIMYNWHDRLTVKRMVCQLDAAWRAKGAPKLAISFLTVVQGLLKCTNHWKIARWVNCKMQLLWRIPRTTWVIFQTWVQEWVKSKCINE
jgi:hypothetical protein